MITDELRELLDSLGKEIDSDAKGEPTRSAHLARGCCKEGSTDLRLSSLVCCRHSLPLLKQFEQVGVAPLHLRACQF
jgi:hypothetical protein